jgi:hypothetical protein
LLYCGYKIIFQNSNLFINSNSVYSKANCEDESVCRSV